MAKHLVKCSICGEQFDANEIAYVKTSSRRYAHASCKEKQDNELTQEEKDKIVLEDYIKKLFNISIITPKIRKQIKDYTENYNFTYSGIHKALVYFFEIKGNSIEKANQGIGIVGYVYKQAFDYYYALWQAQQKNVNKEISDYEPKVVEITIKSPQRKPKKRKLFSFLDKEEEV